MLSTKPYLLRAFYEWIVDCGCLPYLLVNAEIPGAQVPVSFVEDGKIVLNASPSAVRGFVVRSECVEFSASFSGRAMLVSLPMASIMAIYAKENGQGFFFDEEDDVSQEESDASPVVKKNKPALKLVK